MSIRLALAGNPNCGKTTMFNDLTGATQYVGNWPGVTVEKKEGKFKGDKEVLITDLPGIYSLSPYTLEEVVARDYLVNEKPQAIMNLVDASNIERNLYLTTQLLEMGIPVVIALNMMDIVKKRGDVIDVKKLSRNSACRSLRPQPSRARAPRSWSRRQRRRQRQARLRQSMQVLRYHRECGHRDRKADRGRYRAGAAPLVRCQAVRARQQGAGALHARQGRAGQDREAHHRC